MKNAIVAIVITILLITVGMMGVLLRKNEKNGNSASDSGQLELRNDEKKGATNIGANDDVVWNCGNNWQKYENSVLGIAFCYPKEKWGEAYLEPIDSVTDLEKLVKSEHYYQQKSRNNNGYYDVLNVEFKKKYIGNGKMNHIPVVKLMRNDASINACMDNNISGVRFGCNKNVIPLRKNGDICGYSVNYKKRGTLRSVKAKEGISEIYAECKGGIKTILSESSDYFNWNDFETGEFIGWRYTYSLDLFAYKKLKNGYFDDALIYYPLDSTSQLDYKISNLSEFFNLDHSYKNEKRITLSESEFEEMYKNFKRFVRSIRVFEPISENLDNYKANVNNSNKDFAIVAEYYWALTKKDFKKAYDFKKSKQTFVDFLKQYENIHYAKPYNFEKEVDGTISYFVEYQDHNNPIELYQIKAKIVDGKIDVNFIQKFTTDIVEKGGVIAYGAIRGDKSYVILKKSGREIVIDGGWADYDFENKSKQERKLGEVKFFRNTRFSPRGNYLLYEQGGWEWCLTHLYDINKEKEIAKMESCQTADFTDDEKYFYHCASAGMGGYRAGLVQSVPGFKEVFNVFGNSTKSEEYTQNNGYDSVECKYDKEKRKIIFRLRDSYEDKLPNKTMEYKLNY